MMLFLMSFIIGGTICLIFQILIMRFEASPERMIVVCFIAGAALTPSGFTLALSAVAPGIASQVTDAGKAIVLTTDALLSAGVPALFSVLGLMAFLILLGIIAGMIRSLITKK
ncbi:MAG: hypothetical protein LBD47_09835 [Treponema sp.]|nr:hypothetical protein [Treponema sp.]